MGTSLPGKSAQCQMSMRFSLTLKTPRQFTKTIIFEQKTKMPKVVGKINRESLKITKLIDQPRRSSMAARNYSRRSSLVTAVDDSLGKTLSPGELEDNDNHNIIQLHVSKKLII